MKPIYYLLIGFILGLLFFYYVGELYTKPALAKNSPKETIIKDSIITKEVEVIKWKKLKGEIKYITVFDTLATIDTVLVELIKCDSVVKLDDKIIAGDSSIIKDQKDLIELKEKDLKREKRKTLFTKVVAGVAIVVTILLVK